MAPHRSLTEALEARARPDFDLTGVAEAVCEVVGAVVPYDFGCLAATDPSTGLVSWAYKSRPLEIGDEEFAAAEYSGPDVNQFVEIATRREPVGVLSIDTDGDTLCCARFRDFLAPRFGFTDELRAAFRVRGLTWGVLALYRGAGEPAFTAPEAHAVASVQAPVAELIQRALFRWAQPTSRVPTGPAVIVVDAHDQVLNLTAAARARIEELGGWDYGSLPSTVLATSAAARSTPALATSRAVGRDGVWFMIRATTFAASPTAGTATSSADVVITIDLASPTDIGSLALAARSLSPREHDVAALVLRGVSTTGISETLHLSPHTVQDHLKSIFTKLGVNSRREMVQQLVIG